jgi:phage-related baseplate assembly protein
MADPFLAGLPDPTVIDEISFEAILASMKTDLIARFPAIEPILALESSAAVKVMQVAAYREMLLRSRINFAARANLLAYATGNDLDHVGANASPPVARMYQEGDERFRTRILDAVRARNTGSLARYRFVAMSADIRIANAIAYREGRSPTVYVAILSNNSDGAADAALIATVQAAFDLLENRMVNGAVVVRSAVTAVVNIAASLTIVPGMPNTLSATAEKALRDAWAAEGGLGRDLTRDWIKARLQIPGVYSVAVSQPIADIIKPPFEAASLGTVTLTIAGENT